MSKLNDKCVYIMYCESTGLTKIGASHTPYERMKALVNSCGCSLDMVYHTPVIENHAEAELWMHDKFKDSRKRGEWFDVDPLIAYKTLESVPTEINHILKLYLEGISIDSIEKLIGERSRTDIEKIVLNKEWDAVWDNKYIEKAKDIPEVERISKKDLYAIIPKNRIVSFNEFGIEYSISEDGIIIAKKGNVFSWINEDDYKKKQRKLSHP